MAAHDKHFRPGTEIELINKLIDIWMNGGINRWIMDRWMNGGINRSSSYGYMDEWMDK